jgi:hypothetical protein
MTQSGDDATESLFVAGGRWRALRAGYACESDGQRVSLLLPTRDSLVQQH